MDPYYDEEKTENEDLIVRRKQKKSKLILWVCFTLCHNQGPTTSPLYPLNAIGSLICVLYCLLFGCYSIFKSKIEVLRFCNNDQYGT